jgi:mRNA degradation ribonuclease J1/J2
LEFGIFNSMTKSSKESLRIIPLGGLGEVGRNMMLLEYKGEILILDMGFRLPEEDMPGVDYIIPNVEYLKDKKDKILGVVFTHGHYDHIGAVPYLMPKLWTPNLVFFASPLTQRNNFEKARGFPRATKIESKRGL